MTEQETRERLDKLIELVQLQIFNKDYAGALRTHVAMARAVNQLREVQHE